MLIEVLGEMLTKELMIAHGIRLKTELYIARTVQHHPTLRGNATEEIWRNRLKAILPSRFSIGSGTVFDAHGDKSDQIDCIVYDGMYTPKFFGENNELYIPAEAVYAVFEIKQIVDKECLNYVVEKLRSVRNLHRTSSPYISDGETKEPKEKFEIIGGLLASEIEYKEGVNSTKFQERIDEFQCKHETYINVILTPAGTIDFFDIGYPVPSTYKQYTDCSEISLGVGIYRLVRALILQGTVIAIDISYYQNAIEKNN